MNVKSRGYAHASNDGLETRILSVFERLTQKQQILARLMMDNQLYIAFASTDDVGQRAGVDAATVVRFSRLLGYKGFSDLRDSVRKSVPQFLTAVEKVSTTLERARDTGDVLADVYAQDVRNIEETARINSPRTIADAAELLENAANIVVIGAGLGSVAAHLLTYNLSLLGVRARELQGDLIQATADLASVRTGDAVVAISLWRYVKHVNSLFTLATEAGAAGLVIADSVLSPVARTAEIVLVAQTETPELSHSLTSLISVTNVLTTCIALRNPTEVLERLKQVDDSYSRLELIADE